MSTLPYPDMALPLATDGHIAVLNLDSARSRSWSRFAADPSRPGIAELIVEQERLNAQFAGDMTAFDRLQRLAPELAATGATLHRVALIRAQVSSMRHCFGDAREHLAEAAREGAAPAAVHRLELSVDQACGICLDGVLEARRELAQSDSLENLMPLGALLADLGDYAEADSVYRRALSSYADVSPFALASNCFQLGVLWGEAVSRPQADKAELWYRRAIGYVPAYTKARVHLSEIQCANGRPDEAEAMLRPVVASGDPEVNWRLADALALLGKPSEAEAQMQAARSGFEALLDRHLLAFADHGAEFYSGSGHDSRRALELAQVNVANRPNPRAFRQAYEIATDNGDRQALSQLLTAATKRWGHAVSFPSSSCGTQV